MIECRYLIIKSKMYCVKYYENYLSIVVMLYIFAYYVYVYFMLKGGWELVNSALRELMDVIAPLSLYVYFA